MIQEKATKKKKEIKRKEDEKFREQTMNALTVGKVLLVYEMSMQVFPTAPSPTVTHLINLDALMLKKTFSN